MKKLLVIVLAMLLIGCGGRNIPTCDSEEVLTTTQEIIYDYSKAATEEAIAIGISTMAGRATDRNKMNGLPDIAATEISLSAIRSGTVVPEEQLRYCKATLNMTYPDLNKAKDDWRDKITKTMMDVPQGQGIFVDIYREQVIRNADLIASVAFMRIMHLSGDTEYQILYSIQNTTTSDEFVVTVEPFLEILYEE